jgi:hypothetical protein
MLSKALILNKPHSGLHYYLASTVKVFGNFVDTTEIWDSPTISLGTDILQRRSILLRHVNIRNPHENHTYH